MNIKTQANLMVLFANFLIGGSFLASQSLANSINPISLNLLRFVVALILLTPLILLKKDYRNSISKTINRGLILGFFYASYFICMFEALKTTAVLNTSSIYTLMPFLTGIFSIYFFGAKIGIKKLITYAFGMVGTLWVIFKGDFKLLQSLEFNSGDIIFFIGTISMCLYSIFMRKLYKKDDTVIVMNYCAILGGIIVMSIALLISQTPLEWEKINQTSQIFNVLYLAIGTTIITLFLFQKATITLTPNHINSYVYFNPAIVSILNLAIFGIVPEAVILVGISISAVATFILQKSE